MQQPSLQGGMVTPSTLHRQLLHFNHRPSTHCDALTSVRDRLVRRLTKIAYESFKFHTHTAEAELVVCAAIGTGQVIF